MILKRKVGNKMSNEGIKYFKDDENLTLNVEKRGQQEMTTLNGLPTANENEVIERVQTTSLGIAPTHVREYEIEKPKEKEPSLFKMISNKIRGNDSSGPHEHSTNHHEHSTAAARKDTQRGEHFNDTNASKQTNTNTNNVENIQGNK